MLNNFRNHVTSCAFSFSFFVFCVVSTNVHLKKKIPGGTHGSSCICRRGWPIQSSMGGEALGPVMVLCPSIGECQGQEAGVGRLGSRTSGEGLGDFWRGK